MTVSLHLNAWVLPGLLALLVVSRDLVYLWPRWRERAVPALIAMAGFSGLWVLFHLASVVAVSHSAKVAWLRLEYLPAVLAPVALFVFGLLASHRRDDLWRWPGLALYMLSAGCLAAVLSVQGLPLVLQSTHLSADAVAPGLVVTHGPIHLVVVAVRWAATLGTAWVLVEARPARTGELRAPVYVAAAAALALSPALVDLAAGGASWSDLSGVGFAFASAALSLGLLRPRLLGLGPVARTLVMNELSDPILVIDGKGRIVDVNRAAERLLGVRAFGDVPLPLGTLWAASRRESRGTPRDGAHPRASETPTGTDPATGKEGGRDVVLQLGDGEGAPVPHTFSVTVTHLEAGGAPGRSALLLRDVTARRRMERELREATGELERLANTDPLTGLANRRHFEDMLGRDIERGSRYERPLSLVLLDLDHFKQVNDTHGHAAGDDVLRAAADVLRAACRDVDVAARIGGEELALLLPETAAEGAASVAARVRVELASIRHASPEGGSFQVTASIGVASTRTGDSTGEALLQAADEALYTAKGAGRNRVVIAS